MEALKKMGIFLLLFIAIVGAVCSLGWLAYHREWFAFIGALVVILFAAPTWVRLSKKLLG